MRKIFDGKGFEEEVRGDSGRRTGGGSPFLQRMPRQGQPHDCANRRKGLLDPNEMGPRPELVEGTADRCVEHQRPFGNDGGETLLSEFLPKQEMPGSRRRLVRVENGGKAQDSLLHSSAPGRTLCLREPVGQRGENLSRCLRLLRGDYDGSPRVRSLHPPPDARDSARKALGKVARRIREPRDGFLDP